jgi:hypothetical protein
MFRRRGLVSAAQIDVQMHAGMRRRGMRKAVDFALRPCIKTPDGLQ